MKNNNENKKKKRKTNSNNNKNVKKLVRFVVQVYTFSVAFKCPNFIAIPMKNLML